MSRGYDFAMQKHGKGERKKRKQKVGIKEVELVMPPIFKETNEPANDTTWKWGISLPDHGNEGMKSLESSSIFSEDFPPSMHAVGIGTGSNHIGQEFSGISDRISKLLSDYDEMYEDKDQLGYAAMQEQLSGQIAMESLLSDYKSVCSEREELLSSLQDSLDMDEDEILNELEKLNKENLQSVDMEGAQQAIRDTFQNIKSTTNKLQEMNQQMLILTKKGQSNQKLEEEKRQLEKELQMFKKVAVQQRKDIFNRRSSVLRDQTQQWKLVAGEMLDILTMVRSAGNLDREALEREFNRILMTLNSQTEYIDSLKTDLTKQEEAYKSLEKDRNRLSDDKVLVEDQLRSKQQELKYCKQYLRKLLGEKKDGGKEKIKADQEEIDLTSSISEDDGGTNAILQAQIRDARKLMTKLEEENKELQRKLAAQSSSTGLPIDQQKAATLQAATREPTSATDTEAFEVASSHECPRCSSYQVLISNQIQELKNKDDQIERLKKDSKNLTTHLTSSTKGTSRPETEEEGVQEERLEDPPAPEMEGAAPSELQVSPGNEFSQEEPKRKTKETTKLTVPKGDSKNRTAKSPRKPKGKKAVKIKQGDKDDQSEKDLKEVKDVKEVEEEEEEEEEDKEEAKHKEKEPKKKDIKRTGYRGKRILVDECREEKAPYVKVREARMLTVANKGTQTSHYDNLTESITQRNGIGWQPPGRRNPLAETIMAGVTPSEMQQETKAAMSFIKEQADRLCEGISSFVDCGFDIFEQGAKTNRIIAETQLAQNAVERLDSDDVASQLERANIAKALVSTGPRRQSLFANKGHRSSINLERRGTRKHSILPFSHSLCRELRQVSVTGQCSTKKEMEEVCVLGNKALGGDNVTDQSRLLDSNIKESGEEIVNQQRATEQGPPKILVNPLFADQQTTGEADQDLKGSEPLPCTETRARDGALALPVQETPDAKQVFDPTFMKSKPWSSLNNFVESIISSPGAGCSQVVNAIKLIVQGSGLLSTEDQIREQIKVTAQHAIDTIQSTAEILNQQLQVEADKYEKCYALLEKQETSTPAHNVDKRDGPNKDSILFPPIVTQGFGTRVSVAPATAELSRKGMMIIQASGHRLTETPLPSTSNRMRKRGKLANHSRRQVLLKQKEVKDKELNVHKRNEDLNHAINKKGAQQMNAGVVGLATSTSIGQQYKQRHPINQGIPLTMSQDFYQPPEASSVPLPTLHQPMQIQRAFDHQQIKAEAWKKEVPPAEPATGIANEQETPTLPGMTTANTVWQRKNSVIPKFSSEKAIRHSFSEHQTKLPHLNINQILKVGH